MITGGDSIFKKMLIYLMFMGVLPTCIPVNVHHVNVWFLQWPETGTGFPGNGVLSGHLLVETKFGVVLFQ